MDKKRQLEIALKILVWRYRRLGTARFMAELQTAAEDIGIPDDEMFEFYKTFIAGMQ
jgi:hypothetical protein